MSEEKSYEFVKPDKEHGDHLMRVAEKLAIDMIDLAIKYELSEGEASCVLLVSASIVTATVGLQMDMERDDLIEHAHISVRNTIKRHYELHAFRKKHLN